MNLRKKKKRLKKQVESMRAELDSLMKIEQPVVRAEHPRVETLRAVQCINTRAPECAIPDEYMHNTLNKMLIERASTFGCIIYNRCKKYPTIDLFPDEYIYSAEMRVVVPDGGDGF